MIESIASSTETHAIEVVAASHAAARYVLRLYVTGSTPRSARAISNIRKICEDHLKGRYDLEVVDISQHPTLAEGEQIIAAPTLIKKLPLPLRRFIGDMSQTERILLGLDLRDVPEIFAHRWPMTSLDAKSPPKLNDPAENADLRARLEEAEETLRAIRSGEADALVVKTDAGERIFVLEGADTESNRFRGEILAQVSDAIIVTNSEDRVIYLNAATERLYGLTASEALGRLRSEIYRVRWQYPEQEAAKATALEGWGQWRGEYVHITSDGRELFVESSVTALHEIDGLRSGTLAVVRDVTARKQGELKLLISEIRYRRLFETAHDGVLILDPITEKIIDANPYMSVLLGYTHDQLIGKELFEIGLVKDEVASREMVHELIRTRQTRYENLPLESQGGRHQDVEVVANLYDENGRAVIQFNIRDITERRRSEEHVKVLMAEVNHRAKNLLAVVQAIAFQTVKHGDPAVYVQRLCERIGGLAAGHDLLVRSEWHGIDVMDLVESQLAHFKDLIGTRVLISGPRLQLTTSAAQAIGMALHELATNAGKYGALSNSVGRVSIAWQVAGETEPMFSISWLEDGGPTVRAPTRRGFGSAVIGRLTEAAVHGVVEVLFQESGVSWNVKAPVKYALAPIGGGHDDGRPHTLAA